MAHYFSYRRIFLIILTTSFLMAERAGWFQELEAKIYDLGVMSSNRPADKRIVLITVDKRSINTLGNWPWDGQYELKLLAVLSAYSPKLIVDTRFIEVKNDKIAIEVLNKARKKLENTLATTRRVDANDNPERTQPLSELETLLIDGVRQLDIAGEYTKAIGRAGNIILPLEGTPHLSIDTPSLPLPNGVTKHSIPVDTAAKLPRMAISRIPPPENAAQATALGLLMAPSAMNTTVRTATLGYKISDHIFPSMALVIAAKHFNIQLQELQFHPNTPLTLGQWVIPHGPRFTMLTRFYHNPKGQSIFPNYSFVDVLDNKIPAETFRKQIVLIGFTAPELAPQLPTPLKQSLTPVEILAHEVATILNQDAFKSPAWSAKAKYLLYLAIGLLGIIAPNWLPRILGLILGLLLSLSLLGAHFYLMLKHSYWFPTTAPTLMTLLATLAYVVPSRHHKKQPRIHSQSEIDDSNRMLGLALQGQRRLDLAFERFRQCQPDELTINLLYHLAIDFEESRNFNGATAVLEYIGQKRTDYRDCIKRLESYRTMAKGDPQRETSAQSPFTPLPKTIALMDRYRLEEELGRGVFGTVWHGHDDTTHREVAIKVIPLQERFPDDKSFLQAKTIFTRMAESRANLRHHNIIRTEEAQILNGKGVLVMEYFAGHNLERYTEPGKLLPLPLVIQLIAKTAMTLDHAHRLNIVHGGLKPGNILFNEQSQEIKLTGFCQTMLLETPSDAANDRPWKLNTHYMPPEQLPGEKPSLRWDIYALGMIFLQLTTGTRPQTSSSLPELFPPKVPQCLIRIITRCLSPDPSQRFGSCIELAKDLVDCIKSQVSKQ
ncbi:MAG: CHASE2 domain-containing protein [Magnetococcales bacterium]|nr:CHASE2 domain-containing protein [Magnetococcales bacterium]